MGEWREVGVQGYEIGLGMPFLDTLCYLCLAKSRETLVHLGLDYVLRRAIRSSHRRSQAFYEPFRFAHEYSVNGYREHFEIRKLELNLLAYEILPKILDYAENRLQHLEDLLALLASTNSVDVPMMGYKFVANRYLLDIVKGAEKAKLLAKVHTNLTSLRRVTIFVDNAGETLIDIAILAKLAQKFGIEKLTIFVRRDPYEVDVTYQDLTNLVIEMLQDTIDDIEVNIVPRRPYPLVPADEKINDIIKADIILIKGIANFECFLEDMREDLARVYHENTFLLFRAKCPVLASFFNVPIGTPIVIDKLFIEEVLGYG